MALQTLETLPLLDPQALDAHAEQALREIFREGTASNTVASYRGAIRYWAAWFELRYGRKFALPVSSAVVIQYVLDHVTRSGPEGPKNELPGAIDAELVRLKAKSQLGCPALNTVMQRISVLSKAHDLHGHPNPTKDAAVRELVAKARRAYGSRGITADKKDALLKEHVERLLATCDESLRGTRDRALLLFAWSSGGRRRSEVTAATMENTRPSPDGYTFTLGRSKTNQSGTDAAQFAKPIVGQAAAALAEWLRASGITSGPIFRRIRRGDIIGEPLAAAAVRDIVLARCQLAGLEGNFSAHSLRSGFVTEAGRRGVPIGDAMALTGHTSVAIALGYYRSGSLSRTAAARLMDE